MRPLPAAAYDARTSGAAPPPVFGSYLLLRKLGEGGMGTVWAAEDRRRPGRLVALKLISAPLAGSEGDEPTLRFQRESRILESLRHPNVVTLFETGVVNGERFVAMELLKGRTLNAFVGSPWPRTVPLLLQVCHGMEYLASRGIVHRDLSPENVFVVAEGGELTAKILDFGIAKDTTAKETLHDFTHTGVLMGKPPYWSPEQIELESGQVLDWRSDLYTLGVIFFRVLSGSLPFEAESPVGYIPLHLFAPPPELTAPEGRPGIPPPLAALVRRMLAKVKEERPASYAEVVEVLEAVRRDAPAVPAEETGPLDLAAAATRQTAPWETEATRSLDRTAGGDEPPTVAIGLRTVEAGSAATLVTGPSRPLRRAPRTAALAASGLLAAAAAGVGGYLALRPGAPPPEPAAPVVATETTRAAVPGREAPAAPSAAPDLPAEGIVALDAVPWGRLVSAVDLASGRPVPLPADPVTPLRLALPPGRYRLALARDGTAGHATPASPVRVDVTVAAGATRSLVVPLLGSPEAAALLD